MVTIAVDAMGGDFGPSVVVPGALDAARVAGCGVIFTGDSARIKTELSRLPSDDVPVEVVHASEEAGMHEKPSDVLRRKKDTSIQVACQLVVDGRAHGVVSAGNSGVVAACGIFMLGRIEGVDRPGLASIMPTEKGPVVLMDVGANVDCKPMHLFQFGIMADVLAKDLLNIESPEVALLNIGEEEGKGNIQVKEAYELFKKSDLHFIGNVESGELFSGNVDVVICDGFVGNVVLKLSEGVAASFGHLLRTELNRRITSKIGVMLTGGAFRRFARLMDYAEYGGAPLVGLKKIAMICHGRSNSKAIASAVTMAVVFVRKKTTEHLVRVLSDNEKLLLAYKAAK